jgi:hypothetical protein
MERSGQRGIGWQQTLPQRPKDYPMLAFEIIGCVFVLLFLAAAMTGIEGASHR